MNIFAPTQKLIRVLDDLLVRGNVSGGQITFTPEGAFFTNSYFSSSICHGRLLPEYFIEYSVTRPETIRFTSTMLANLKAIKDPNATILTSQENVMFKGETQDSYSEPMTSLHEELPIDFVEHGQGRLPVSEEDPVLPIAELRIKRSALSTLPSAEEYYMTLQNDRLSIEIRGLGNFTRNVEVNEFIVNENVTVLLDNENFKYAFNGPSDDCVVFLNPDLVIGNYATVGYSLNLAAATRRI